MSVQNINYGKNLALRGIKLKIDFYDEPFIDKLTSESTRSFKEAYGYRISDVYDKNRKKILAILEKGIRRMLLSYCNPKS